MSLTHMKDSISRGAVLAALVFAPAASASAFAMPQVTTATSAPRAASTRARCVGCSDSTKAKHEMLLNKLDSLRWEFSNRRLTQVEQEVFAREMSATLQSLQQFMEINGGRLRMAPSARAETMSGGFAGAAVGSATASGGSYVITLQTSKRGYMGVTFDGPSLGYPPEQPDVIRFIQYPKIASVDPASPAERAGLLVGDTLLAMNGTDVVEHSITLSKLLVPDEKVTLKVRRDGDAKEFRVVVGEAPAYIARRMSPPPMTAEAPAPQWITNVPPSRAEVSARARVASTPSAPAPATPRGWEEPVQPTRSVFVFGNAVAGARVETLSEGLARAIGAKEGVLVIQAPPSSPAYVSGLRDGDVIVSVAGTLVATVRQLSSAIFNADREDGVKIVILREKKQQDLILRWK